MKMTKAQLLTDNQMVRAALTRVQAENIQLKTKLTERLDLSMIEARTKLVSQLGQMMEAFTRAIGYIIAKETL